MGDTEMSDALATAQHGFEMEVSELTKQRDDLRAALQNIIWGIETGAVEIRTAQDETWANAMAKARRALSAIGTG